MLPKAINSSVANWTDKGTDDQSSSWDALDYGYSELIFLPYLST